MHFTLTPGNIGAISLVVSAVIFFKTLARKRIKDIPKDVLIVCLKLKAKLRNQLFIFSEKIALSFHKTKIRKIFFSRNEEWAPIINRSFSERNFKLDFKAFNMESLGSYDLVVPLNIPDLRLCIEHRNLLAGQVIPIPSAASVDICDNKTVFNKFMIENGFGAYIPNIESPFKYPYMLKKNIDEYGRSTFIIESPIDEHMHMADLNDESYYCQELISGKHEYATHIIFKEGRMLSSLNIRYTFANDNYIKGKELYICKEVCQSHHLELFTDILEKIGFEGICCFNYKEVDGKPMIFEINPRFGGSLTDYFFSFIRKLDKVA